MRPKIRANFAHILAHSEWRRAVLSADAGLLVAHSESTALFSTSFLRRVTSETPRLFSVALL